MKPAQVYISDRGQPFNTPLEAIIDDVKGKLITDAPRPKSGSKIVSTEDIVAVLKWGAEQKGSLLQEYFQQVNSE